MITSCLYFWSKLSGGVQRSRFFRIAPPPHHAPPHTIRFDYLIHSPHPSPPFCPLVGAHTLTLTPILVADTSQAVKHLPSKTLPNVSAQSKYALDSPLSSLSHFHPSSISTSHSSSPTRIQLRQTALLASHPPYKPTRFPSQLQTRPVAAQLNPPLTKRHADSLYTTNPAIPRHCPARSPAAFRPCRGVAAAVRLRARFVGSLPDHKDHPDPSAFVF